MGIAHQIEAAKRRQAGVAQRKEQGSSKAKVEGSPTKSQIVKFLSSAEILGPEEKVMSYTEAVGKLVQKHKERLAYNAAYQRDLRTIKRLGLNCTVKEYRESVK